MYENGKFFNITNEVGKKLLDLDRNTGLQLAIGIRDDKSDLGDYNQNWQSHYSELALLSEGGKRNEITKLEEIEIGGYSSALFLSEAETSPQSYSLFSFLEVEGKLYEVILKAFNKNQLLSNKKLFNQILSTFKFIEATPEASPTSTPSGTITP